MQRSHNGTPALAKASSSFRNEDLQAEVLPSNIVYRPLGNRATTRPEKADAYFGFVVQLNPNWRVVGCCDRIQWILQRRGSPKRSRRDDWRGRSYCRTSEALRRCAREYAGAMDESAEIVLNALPAWIESDITCVAAG